MKELILLFLILTMNFEAELREIRNRIIGI